MSADRTVHAASAEVEIVRYDRSGKWYLEPKDGSKRSLLSLSDAVSHAAEMVATKTGRCFAHQPGGSTFDRKVKTAVSS